MLHVLLLDDYDDSRERTARALRDAGHEVTAVAEEEEAMQTLDRRRADVVLFDLPLDEAEGAAAALREIDGCQNSVFVALAEPSLSLARRVQGRVKGIDRFFLRPCPPAEIVKHLRRLRR